MSRLPQLLVVLVGLLAALDVSHARLVQPCELAYELSKQGVSRDLIANFVCLAKHESGFNTAAIGSANYDGSSDHGIFQFSDKFWCDANSYQGFFNFRAPSKNACGTSCYSLRDNDIRDDVACAMTVFREHQQLQGNGFLAWEAWKANCQGRNVWFYIAGCGV